MVEQIAAVRAGFWRRAIAFIVDSIIIGLLIQIVAPLAFHATDGHVQLGSPVLKSIQCEQLQSLPPGIAPLDFQPNFATRCVTSIFGWPMSRTAIVGRSTKQGSNTSAISASFAVDESGHATQALWLDWLLFPLLLLFRWWQDRDWASPGRQLADIRVVDVATGERRPAGLAKRYVLFALFFAAAAALQIGLQHAVAFLTPLDNAGAIFLIVLPPVAISLLILLVPIVRRRDVFYDRWSGTAVLLNNPPKAEESTSEPMPNGTLTPASASPR